MSDMLALLTPSVTAKPDIRTSNHCDTSSKDEDNYFIYERFVVLFVWLQTMPCMNR